MNSAKLLVVDDNVDVREITALLLRDMNFEVLEADGGKAALALIAKDPSIDLMLIDFAMPGMSGADLLRTARITRPEIKALFITGYADYARLQGEFGGEIVLRKPYTTEQLIAAIHKALAP
ncbi:MAG TPA: response regulator [Candidatus Binataceae bacterium]|nr:response regulator [Candidatus Binataceae bacterium]